MSEDKSLPVPELSRKPIQVASLLDRFRVVLNVGSDDGIRPRDRFLVYALGSEIVDPVTQESLGALEVVRGRGEVEHLQARICTIRSLEYKRVAPIRRTIKKGDGPYGLSGFVKLAAPEEVIEEGGEDINQPFKDPQVGDFARKLT